jgi:hypothetical protein
MRRTQSQTMAFATSAEKYGIAVSAASARSAVAGAIAVCPIVVAKPDQKSVTLNAHTIDDLSVIAASVASALGLQFFNYAAYGKMMQPPVDVIHDRSMWRIPDEDYGPELEIDGSNVFADPWRWRCLEWLLGQGWVTCFESREYRFHTMWCPGKVGQMDIRCPASEFPARAIHRLMQARP